MVAALEDGYQRLSHLLQIPKCQVTVIKLAVSYTVLDQPVNEFLNLLHGPRSIGSGGSFCLVGQHQDGCLTRSRPGSRISKSRLVRLSRHSVLRTGLAVEVT